MNALSRSPLTAGPAGTDAASMVWKLLRTPRAGGGKFRHRPIRRKEACLVGRCLDGLVELQLATLDRVDAVVRQRGVAVLVERVRAEHALAVLGLEERLEDVLLLAGAGALDRVQRQAHGLVAVDGVRVRVLVAVLLLEVRE